MSMSRDIEIGLIRANPRQPRKHFEGIEELAQSLREKGQLVPVLVRPVEGGFELVHGERRWRAAKLAGLPTLRAEVRELSDTEAFHLSLIENVGRQQLTAIEEAEAFEILVSGGMTQAQVGALVGKGQSYIAHKLRLLKAPEPIKVLVAMNALSEGHARQLLRLEGLYPGGKRWVQDKPPERELFERDTCFLIAAYNCLRPEDQPLAPLWCFPYKHIEECSHKAALFGSFEGLLGYYDQPDHAAPQWVVSAWWYGAAAIVYGLSVAFLARIIDAWWERFKSSVVYLHVIPEASGGKDEQGHWWAAWADLRHGGCLPITDADADFILEHKNGGIPTEWVMPSSYQRRALMERLEVVA